MGDELGEMRCMMDVRCGKGRMAGGLGERRCDEVLGATG